MSYETERAITRAAIKHQEEQCSHAPHPCPLTDHQRTFNPEFCLGLLDKLERYEKALGKILVNGHPADKNVAYRALNPTEANDG